MTDQPSHQQNGKFVMQHDDWEDGPISVSADEFVSQLDAEMNVGPDEEEDDMPLSTNPISDAPPGAKTDEAKSDNSVMQPATGDTDEPIMHDLASVMQPATDDTDEPIMHDLASVMQPATDDTDTPTNLTATSKEADVTEEKTMADNTSTFEADYDADESMESVSDFLRTGGNDKDDVRSIGRGETLTLDPATKPSKTPYLHPDGPIPYVSPRSALSQKSRHYIETRWYPQWKYYDEKAAFNKARHINLQIFVAIGSVSVPIIIGISFIPTWIPALISGLVAIFTAIENVMKYGDNWRAYRNAAEGLNREKVLYEALAGPYDRTNAPFRMFVERSEDIIAEETGRYFERTEEPDDEQRESQVNSVSES